jgi:hypothetical protein
MSRTKDMCIIAKACNYKALRQIKSRPHEGAVDLNVHLLKVNLLDFFYSAPSD